MIAGKQIWYTIINDIVHASKTQITAGKQIWYTIVNTIIHGKERETLDQEMGFTKRPIILQQKMENHTVNSLEICPKQVTQVGNKKADLHFKENGPAGETEKGLLSSLQLCKTGQGVWKCIIGYIIHRLHH